MTLPIMASSQALTNNVPKTVVSPPLAQIFVVSVEVLRQVLVDEAQEQTVETIPLSQALLHVAIALRPAVQNQCYRLCRQWGLIKQLRNGLLHHAPPQEAQFLLDLALDELLADMPRSDYVVVSQAVEAAKKMAINPALVNGVLRRFLREKASRLTAAQKFPEAQHQHPQWWLDALRQDHPKRWQKLVQQGNSHPPLALRVNPAYCSRDEYLNRLANLPNAPLAYSGGVSLPQAVYLPQSISLDLLPGFKEGGVMVQDLAAQMAGYVLQHFVDGQWGRVLDACAAPGGKTLHLAELGATDITAVDSDEARLQRVTENWNKAQQYFPNHCMRIVHENLVQIAMTHQEGFAEQSFHTILLDAPCTASGIVRRQADVRWRRQPKEVSRFAHQQFELLRNVWPLLQQGGILLYVTCSLFHAENQGVLQRFLGRHGNARCLMRSSSYDLTRHLPDFVFPEVPSALPLQAPTTSSYTYDGFYYAVLQKARE